MRRLTAEALGTAMLLLAVVGSGIMAERLSGGNTGVALLANAIATGAMLFVIITVLGPISGAHFNPAVTLAFALRREISPREATGFVVVQCLGAVIGVWAAHIMFELPILQLAQTPRGGGAQLFSEVLATAGLLFVIFGGVRANASAVPTLVALYITGAYWFTASTSFANPAVTLARSLSDTFAGIAPHHAPGFILAQLCAVAVCAWGLPRLFER